VIVDNEEGEDWHGGRKGRMRRIGAMERRGRMSGARVRGEA
jgi:hypothetical protein